MNRLKKPLSRLMDTIAPVVPEEYDSDGAVGAAQESTIMFSRQPGMTELFSSFNGESFLWRWTPGNEADVRVVIANAAAEGKTALTYAHAAILNREIRAIEQQK